MAKNNTAEKLTPINTNIVSKLEKEIVMEPHDAAADQEAVLKEAFSDYCKRNRLRMRIWSGQRLPGHAKLLSTKTGRWVLEIFTGPNKASGQAEFEYPAGVRGLKYDAMIKYLRTRSFPG